MGAYGGQLGGHPPCYLAMSLFYQGKQDDARELFIAAEAKMNLLPFNDDALERALNDDQCLGLAYKEAGAQLRLPLRKLPRPVKEVLVPPTSEWTWLHPLDSVDPAEGAPDFPAPF